MFAGILKATEDVTYAEGPNSDTFVLAANQGTHLKQELRSWFEVNAKFPSTTPRLNITFSFHDPQNKKYKLRTVDELGKGMAIY